MNKPNSNTNLIAAMLFVVCLIFAVTLFLPSDSQAATSKTKVGLTIKGQPAPTNGAAGTSSSRVYHPSVTVDGDDAAFYTLNVFTSDNTGTGCGWHENMSQTTFESASGHYLGSSQVDQVVVDAAPNNTDTMPSDANHPVQYPVALPSDGSAATFLVADGPCGNGTGLGNFIVKPTVEVQVPSGTPNGNYSATVRVSIYTGP